MSPLRIAVFGGGHLGTIHARLLQQVHDAQLLAIVEPNPQRAVELKQQFACDVVTDVDGYAATADFDAAVLAAPTTLHHKLGLQLFARGIHCLIEKPLAPTESECRELVEAAEQSHSILQVGHVERFNPAWTSLCSEIGEPRLIEAYREAPLTFRSLDAGVILDLMIHDIDLIQAVVKSSVAQVQANGYAWTGPAEDFASARVTFANGAIANLTASRISCKPKREMRIWGHDWYGEIDFASRTGHVIDAPESKTWQSASFSAEERQELIDSIFDSVTPRKLLNVPEANPILDELFDFTTSIRTSSQPIVDGQAGLAAVSLANQIQQMVNRPRLLAPSDYRPRRKAG